MNIGDALIKSLGIDPAEFHKMINGVIADFQTMRGEAAAAKTGFQTVVAHFDKRLTQIENRLIVIESALLPSQVIGLLRGGKDGTPDGGDIGN